jgi:glycosyltransferase involved in cell wall biosynthesis
MFCGAMDVTMNIDAVERFANEVFPKVKQEMPDSEFWVVGKDPMKKVKALGSQQGIKITGTVEDVRPYYEEATLFVAPFRFGGGTKLKILEAMAMGIPIISTDVGCQGIEVVNGEHVIIENNLNNFAPKIMHLLNCKEERKMISKNARYLVEEKYSWKGIISNIERKIRDLVKEKDDFKQKCHHFNVPSQAQNSAASKRSSVEHDLTMFN